MRFDDRPQFADHARNAGATEVICQPFEDALDQIEGDKDTYFVVLTRGHRYDQVCLEKIVGKEHAYIGMIGSRRRSAMVKQNLILEDGSCVGTIGGGCMEAEVLRKARVMMHENNTGLKTEYVDMTGDDAEEEGMVCGGTIEVLLEPLWN